MLLEELQFDLPDDRIARFPSPERTGARLLGLDRRTGAASDLGTVEALLAAVRPGDVWVVNDTRVRPARVHAIKSTGGHAELLVLELRGETAVAMYRSAKPLRPGGLLTTLRGNRHIRVLENRGDGTVMLALDGEGEALLDEAGDIPLPPYIDRAPTAEDSDRYQTVYARERGAVAAPTAGLHFTPELMAAMRSAGATFATVTLHVGPGTFKPIKTARVEDHTMHGESYQVSPEAAALVNGAKRVIAVGTTSVRALESAATAPRTIAETRAETHIFITPGYQYRVVDALLTNFHLPGSSLLALVGAFAGLPAVKAAYATAIERGFRFYSYGDAMWIA